MRRRNTKSRDRDVSRRAVRGQRDERARAGGQCFRRGSEQSATFDSKLADTALDERARRALAVRIARLWPPGSYALASAAAAIVEAMAGRSRRTACCFVVPDAGSGTRARAAALPVRVDAAGIAEIIQPTLSVVEQVALDNAIML